MLIICIVVNIVMGYYGVYLKLVCKKDDDMKKRIISILALVLVVTGCGSQSAESKSEKEEALECLRTGGASTVSEDSDSLNNSTGNSSVADDFGIN